MIRISQIRLPCGHPDSDLLKKISRLLRLDAQSISFSIVRHSIDARKKPVLYDIYTADVQTGLRSKEEERLVRRLRNKNVSLSAPARYTFPSGGTRRMQHRPVVIGAGPAGLFCALLLAEHGYRPLVVERGRRMEERMADVEKFWRDGILDPASNVQFGEGGAGTFSDGKLNTQINDRSGRAMHVLRVFAQEGAPESILYEAKPHIGTDRLRRVIPNLRRRIEDAGGEFLFDTVCTGFAFSDPAPADADPSQSPSRRILGLYLRSTKTTEIAGSCGEETAPSSAPAAAALSGSAEDPHDAKEEFLLPAQTVVLAIGHSARDTVEMLFDARIPMQQKQFAVGLRVSHPQSLIDESQYGISDPETLASMRLGASPYKLTAKASSGRGVYSFCMCPGGYVVNASSEEGGLCVNGMSDEKRDSGWADSAVVITVGEKEFGSADALAGMRFQRDLEKKAFALGRGAIPVQLYTEFRDSFRKSSDPACTHRIIPPVQVKGAFRKAPLHTLLPQSLTADFIEGMEQFGTRIRGFNGENAVLAGVESRTSSPVRIPRGEDLQSTGAAGLYPCGEGAGYAGGIMSAAMDGMRVAEAIAAEYQPFTNTEGS